MNNNATREYMLYPSENPVLHLTYIMGSRSFRIKWFKGDEITLHVSPKTSLMRSFMT